MIPNPKNATRIFLSLFLEPKAIRKWSNRPGQGTNASNYSHAPIVLFHIEPALKTADPIDSAAELHGTESPFHSGASNSQYL
jgi:hypothetical protein